MSISYKNSKILVVKNLDYEDDAVLNSTGFLKRDTANLVRDYDLVIHDDGVNSHLIKSRFTNTSGVTSVTHRPTRPGYHTINIPKGELGEVSKIREEFLEFENATDQNCPIMELVELSDLYGAIEAYVGKYNLTMSDLKKFSDITKRAFANGRRS